MSPAARDRDSWRPYYDKQGKSISKAEYHRLQSQYDYVIVGKTRVDKIEVSTVWLGLNHNFVDEIKVPIIFETMLFPGDQQCRYATEEAAIKGHAAAVAALRAGVGPNAAIRCAQKVAEDEFIRETDSELQRFSELMLDRN